MHQARDLVFVLSPQFAATSHPSGAPQAHEVDLVDELATRLNEHPSLRIVIGIPRWPDPVTAYGGWVRQAFDARAAAFNTLTSIGQERVQVFIPTASRGDRRWSARRR